MTAMTGARLLLAGLLLGAAACASTPDEEFAEFPPADELYRDGLAELEGGAKFWGLDTTDYPKAIERFQEILDNYPYSEYAVLSELRIADAYFQQGRYEEALGYYRDFADLHPEHERVPYTIYRAALCHEKQGENPGRDQTQTHRALAQLDRLMREHPHSAEALEAEQLWRELRTKLATHVFGIGEFYMAREEWQSAANRFRSVLNEYPGLGLDAEALYNLGRCYGKMQREDEAHRIFEVILENYEGSEIARRAEELIPAAN